MQCMHCGYDTAFDATVCPRCGVDPPHGGVQASNEMVKILGTILAFFLGKFFGVW